MNIDANEIQHQGSDDVTSALSNPDSATKTPITIPEVVVKVQEDCAAKIRVDCTALALSLVDEETYLHDRLRCHSSSTALGSINWTRLKLTPNMRIKTAA